MRSASTTMSSNTMIKCWICLCLRVRSSRNYVMSGKKCSFSSLFSLLSSLLSLLSFFFSLFSLLSPLSSLLSLLSLFSPLSSLIRSPNCRTAFMSNSKHARKRTKTTKAELSSQSFTVPSIDAVHKRHQLWVLHHHYKFLKIPISKLCGSSRSSIWAGIHEFMYSVNATCWPHSLALEILEL